MTDGLDGLRSALRATRPRVPAQARERALGAAMAAFDRHHQGTTGGGDGLDGLRSALRATRPRVPAQARERALEGGRASFARHHQGIRNRECQKETVPKRGTSWIRRIAVAWSAPVPAFAGVAVVAVLVGVIVRQHVIEPDAGWDDPGPSLLEPRGPDFKEQFDPAADPETVTTDAEPVAAAETLVEVIEAETVIATSEEVVKVTRPDAGAD